jgi:phosphoribosyl 1,2-cyclic phosphodiesterase
MVLKVLGSGSSGNCYILENENEALIIEAGLPFMEVKKELDFNVIKIVGVLASHTHGDHAKYIGEYGKSGIPVWKPYNTDFYKSCDMKKYGTFEVRTFPNQNKDRRWLHNNSDGSECPCYGFHIKHPDMGSLVYATDTEYIKWRFKDVNHIMVEANYDMQFVNREEPNYEHRLRGHMSLPTALKFISTNDNPALRNVVLIHLSDKSADSVLFKQKTADTIKYGADVFVAERGLEVDMNLCPF